MYLLKRFIKQLTGRPFKKGVFYRCIAGYTCLALLSFNIAYASSFLPACPCCLKMKQHEHSSHSDHGSQHHLKQSIASSHIDIAYTANTAAPEMLPCTSCNGDCCSDFYHGYMAAITLDIDTRATIFLNKQFHTPTQVTASSFIPEPVHPPPIGFPYF